MGFTAFPSLDVLVALVVGLLATVGAVVGIILVAGVVQGGLAIAGRLAGSRIHAVEIRSRAARTADRSVVDASLDRGPDHALLARQAWWRLRC